MTPAESNASARGVQDSAAMAGASTAESPYSQSGHIRTPRAPRFPRLLGWWLALKLVSALLFATGYNAAAVATYLVLDPVLLLAIVLPRSRGFGPVLSHFRTSRREVWLTIDDGPHPHTTPAVLDLLDRHHAKATFFVVGAQVRKHPELVREIVRRGHSLGNHTETHPAFSFWARGVRGLLREIDDCTQAIVAAGVSPPRYFRPPVGLKSPFLHTALASRGMHLVAWSARGFDRLVSEHAATNLISATTKPGRIVLLHESSNRRSTESVIRAVLEYLSREKIAAVIPPFEELR
jgi:peptidoglycan-N-acetylglucosamine deacetylase